MALITLEIDKIRGPITTVATGISNLLASGINHDDIGILNVYSGSYIESVSINNRSGIIVINGQQGVVISGISSIHSGQLILDNLDLQLLTVTGSGSVSVNNSKLRRDVTITDSNTAQFTNSELYSGVTITNTRYTVIKNTNASGTKSLITATTGRSLKIISGNLSRGGLIAGKVILTGISGVQFDHCYGFGVSNTPYVFDTVNDWTLSHCSFITRRSGTKGQVVYSTGSSGYILNSIICSSGNWPVSGLGGSVIRASGSCITNLKDSTTIGQKYSSVSGYYMAKDPLFVNANKYDLRISANSPCAASADLLESLQDANLNIERIELDENAIQFYVYGQGFKATRPSGIYIVQNGRSLYLQADQSLDNDMSVVINTRYVINEDVTTVQSLTNTKSSTHSYAKDYMITKRLNYQTNIMEDYIQPYTIVPLHQFIAAVNGRINKIYVSGNYQNRGFSRDHTFDADGTSYYWIGDSIHNYLHKYSAFTNELLETYPLFNVVNPTGSFGTVNIPIH